MKHLRFISFVLIIAIAVGYWNYQKDPNTQQRTQAVSSMATGSALTTAKSLPQFAFTTDEGKTFGKNDLKGKWSFVFFGYSSCPELCPTTLENMRHLSQRVGKGIPVQYLFVSIDPQQDTPERLHTYLHGESSPLKDVGFVGLNAPKAQVHELAKSIGIFFQQDNAQGEVHIEHSGAIVLINPNAQLDAIFTDSRQPGTMAQDFKRRVSHFARA